MSTKPLDTPHAAIEAPELEQGIPRMNYLTNGYGWKSWLFTLDHKRIAVLYLISISVFFALGGIAAGLVRLNLLSPHGAIMQPETYNRMFTAHGVIMIFFFLIPSIPATLGNFLIPMMVGAKDLAFPKVNLLSWYVYMLGGVIGLGVIFSGGLSTGWTLYTPLSTQYTYGPVAWTMVGLFMAGMSSILTGLNFIVTIHKMRAPGLTWWRLPLFVWAHYATSIIQILGTPVVAITLLLLLFENLVGVGVFDPKLGGDPVLMQHLFWFYSHPAVYIMILPGMAVINEIIACFSRKPVFGYKMVAFSSLAIAVIGFFVWGHHMFTTAQSPYAAMVFSFLSFLVAIPSAIKVFNWTATLYKGSIRLDTPMLYALAFIGLFTIGGLTGLHLANIGSDIHLQDTYFVVAHFHYVMVGGAITAFLGGLHFWWPKICGRMYPETLGRLASVMLFLGFNMTFFPQFLLGYEGMPRRYATYAPEFHLLNIFSTAGASLMAMGYILPVFYLLWSLKYGKVAGPNPYRATGLEWQSTSPPPTFNFDQTPLVTCEPYCYSPAADELVDAEVDLQRARFELEQVRRQAESGLEAHASTKEEGTTSGV